MAAAVKQAAPEPLDASLALGKALVEELARIKLAHGQKVGQHGNFGQEPLVRKHCALAVHVVSPLQRGSPSPNDEGDAPNKSM